MSEEEVKPWYLSTTIWGGLVAAGVSIAGLFGANVQAIQQEAGTITGLLVGLAGVVGGIVAVVGRIKATKTIGAGK